MKVNVYRSFGEAEFAETRRLINRVIELGNDDAVALAYAGFALAYVFHDLEGAVLWLTRRDSGRLGCLNKNHEKHPQGARPCSLGFRRPWSQPGLPLPPS